MRRNKITIPQQTLNKFKNIRCEVDGIKFPSIKEAIRYNDLKMMQLAGEIFDLKRQVTFKLEINAIVICSYRADFVYRDKKGKTIVEDSKGFITPEFKLKQKLMKAIYGIDILLT